MALTKEHGMVLLEGNFSCNFFRGDFDEDKYFELFRSMPDYFGLFRGI